jgi:SAM-dependent MidA family methyltransferase
VSLGQRIAALIAEEGPITVADYVALCLHDQEGGYYATRPRLGEDGDFITAPMISQMFGELIGLWAAQVWIDMGAPERVLLVEVGPGEGGLMSDALRASRPRSSFGWWSRVRRCRSVRRPRWRRTPRSGRRGWMNFRTTRR